MWDLFTWAFITAVGINFLAFTIAYTYQTDKLTDLTYALTFISITTIGLIKYETSLLQLLVACLVILWALRLGVYLFIRVNVVGKDERFDEMRPSLSRYLGFWSLQAHTCFIVSLPVVILFNAEDMAVSAALIVGTAIAIAGLLLETIADGQKYHFKKRHPNKFMKSGCWKYIRHPNYTGEILFWTGISMAAISSPLGYLGLLSPVWISILLIRISGIPLLRQKWQDKYGEEAAFRSYLKNSWNLVPYLY